MPPAKPTLRDIAKALEISPATVSLALRNDSRIASATRERVIATAHRLGYQLNPAIASLMSQVRTRRKITYQETIAWLNFWDDRNAYSRTGVEFQRLMWRGAQQQALELGYKLDSFWMRESHMTNRRVNDIISARGIRGILIPPLPETAAMPDFDWSAFSAISLSYTLMSPHFDRVTPNHFHNTKLILDTLRERGYRRPGLMIPRGYDDRTGNRCMAAYYLREQQLAKKDRVPVHLCNSDRVDEAIINWLKKYRPDVVIALGAHKDIRHATALDAAYRQRLGLVLLSNASSDAGICGINENPGIIGATAVELLALSLQRNQHDVPLHPKLTQIDGTWVEGDTAPPLNC